MASSPTNSITDGLVGYWTLDGKDTPWTSATAATTLDKSGNGNTGTLTNMAIGTSPIIGKIGQGLYFDGDNDYVDVGNPTALQIAANLTISAWVKPSSFPNTNDRAIVDKTNGNAGLKGYTLDTTYDNGSNQFLIYFKTAAGVDAGA